MTQLTDDWYLIETVPDAFLEPVSLANENFNWLPACVPGTVAQSMANAGLWSLDKRVDFDGQDYWYKTKFSITDEAQGWAVLLSLDGLATLCDVWVNGRNVLVSDNMFLSHQVDISDLIQAENSLYLCFRALKKALAQRRARPRWKTRLVDQQQLRWFRTALIGRIPGWTPPVAPVGPWRAISLCERLTPQNISLNTALQEASGVVEFSCDLHHAGEAGIAAALSVGSVAVKLDLETMSYGSRVFGTVTINDVALWQPHTHGLPRLYPVTLDIKTTSEIISHELTPVGFKRINVDRSHNGFTVYINDTEIFCRGACWTINDVVSLVGDYHSLETTLILMQSAGANMIRIGGTMIYEQDDFYLLCDKLGIMVWQDFMFANMDYPVDDDDFNSSITREVSQHLSRLQKHICVTIYCGNSEIEQQAAMLGMPSEVWSNDFFRLQLPELCTEYHPGIPYLPSAPSGGDFPFHTDAGVSHYYGVGAYKRSVNEVRLHDVKFTSECLGFSNLPVANTRNAIFDKQIPVTHHPKWKERVPRDSGAGWDFEDIRDHYLEGYFSINPVQLRSDDNEKYLALSEIVSGEIMSQVYAEWRSQHSHCAGALVWFLKDFWPGAGWGVIDSHGLPKAAYYYLKRSWQPINIGITNESLNGLHVHVANETRENFTGVVEIILLNEFSVAVVSKKIELSIAPGATDLMKLDQVLGVFHDVTDTYKFGSSKHFVVSARLEDKAACEVGTAFYFPNSALPRIEGKVNSKATLAECKDGAYVLELSCEKFLYAVNIEMPGFIPDENYFHLMPGVSKSIKTYRVNGALGRVKGYISAINMREDVKIKVLPA